jgi:hypothetical protein
MLHFDSEVTMLLLCIRICPIRGTPSAADFKLTKLGILVFTIALPVRNCLQLDFDESQKRGPI